jgi:hypothetical protein
MGQQRAPHRPGPGPGLRPTRARPQPAAAEAVPTPHSSGRIDRKPPRPWPAGVPVTPVYSLASPRPVGDSRVRAQNPFALFSAPMGTLLARADGRRMSRVPRAQGHAQRRHFPAPRAPAASARGIDGAARSGQAYTQRPAGRPTGPTAAKKRRHEHRVDSDEARAVLVTGDRDRWPTWRPPARDAVTAA